MNLPERVGERERLLYLDAMGITAHVARYRLPHAAATPVCDWEEASPEPEQAHGARLHALIKSVDASDRPAHDRATLKAGERETPRPANSEPRSARALLADSEEADETPATPPAVDPDNSGATPAFAVETATEPLRFTLQVAALDGRWLFILAQPEAPDESQRRLLGNILHAAGIRPEQPLDFQLFQWPLMEELPVDDPLEEAREGLCAFVAGKQGRGWRIERVMLFGVPEGLCRTLDLDNEYARLLNVPCWQGPALDALDSAGARRALWQRLSRWHCWWHEAAEGGEQPS